MKIVVLDGATLGFEESYWDKFSEFGTVDYFLRTEYIDKEIVERCSDADIVLTNKVPLNAEVIKQLPNLKLISVLATGYNIIDLAAAKQNGVTVCNVPSYSTDSVAQHTIALILELCNTVGVHSDSVHAGDWVRSPDFSYWLFPPIELQDLTVGIIGHGTIGRKVGEIANVFGSEVLAYSRRKRDMPRYSGFAWAEIEEIFERADIVSLHCPLTDDNRGFVNEAMLKRMKPTSFLINTARGGLVNESDLSQALINGTIAGAALDVVLQEPMSARSQLLKVPNCIITPHIAWASLPSRERLIRITIGNIRGFINQHPVNIVR